MTGDQRPEELPGARTRYRITVAPDTDDVESTAIVLALLQLGELTPPVDPTVIAERRGLRSRDLWTTGR